MSERRKPIPPADARRVCYLRLLGIAERGGPVRRCVRWEMVTPARAVGVFEVGSVYVVASFSAERHWCSTALTDRHAEVEFLLAMERLTGSKTPR